MKRKIISVILSAAAVFSAVITANASEFTDRTRLDFNEYLALSWDKNSAVTDYTYNKTAVNRQCGNLMIDDRIYLPLRQICEDCGFTVSWDDEQKKAYVTATLWDYYDSTTTANIPMTTITADMSGTIVNDRTYVKIRDFEKLGFAIDYYEQDNKCYADIVRYPYRMLRTEFIDIGQGDCEFIQLPNGQNMLIDAGDVGKFDKINEVLKTYNTDKIDYLIATHPHADHIGSMNYVVDNYDIGKIYMPSATANTKTFEIVLNSIKNRGYMIDTAKAGMVIYEDDSCRVEFVAPNSDSYKDLNNYSVVVKITYKDTAYLFEGDAEQLSESEILSHGYNVKANLIKIGHHGSYTSSSKEYLSAVSPQYAIISCGKDNRYGHPHDVTLQTLAELNIPVYRTDEMGTIVATSNGDNVVVK